MHQLIMLLAAIASVPYEYWIHMASVHEVIRNAAED